MGGGWCFNSTDCLARSGTLLGSSNPTFWPESFPLAAFLSSNEDVNPDFYNWNAVFLVYCDGGVFSGDRQVYYVHGSNLRINSWCVIFLFLKRGTR